MCVILKFDIFLKGEDSKKSKINDVSFSIFLTLKTKSFFIIFFYKMI